VKAEDDAADETEEAEAMDTAEDVSTAPVKEEEDDTEMAEPPTAAESNGTPGHRLFVGCVPPKFSEDDLKARFQEVGTCLSLRLRGWLFEVVNSNELSGG
jgi:hypothetical protein